MLLALAVMNNQRWAEYTAICEGRGVGVPHVSEHSILVQDGTGSLVGGAMCYPTPGQYMLLEHLVTRADLPPTESHEVVSFMASCAIATGAILGKYPIAMAKDGVATTLDRAGFKRTGVEALIAVPGLLPEPKNKGPAVRGVTAGPEASGEEVQEVSAPEKPRVKRKKGKRKKR